MVQYISMSSDSLEEFCKDTSFLAKARDVGKKETQNIIDSMPFEDFVNMYANSIWVGFGFGNLDVSKSSSEDGIFAKVTNLNGLNRDYVYRFLEGSVSATLGKDYMLEYDPKTPEDVLLMPLSTVKLTVAKKQEIIDQRLFPGGHAFTSDHYQIFKIFETLLEKNYVGLGITRTFPEKLKQQYKVDNADLIWLTSQKEEGSIQADRWEFELSKTISKFINETGDSGVILLDGLEYLMIHNPEPKRDAIFKQVLQWKDAAISNGTTFLLPLKEKGVSDTYFAILSTEFEYCKYNEPQKQQS